MKDTAILLVEDDDVDAMSIERSFSAYGAANHLVRVRDGIEALELLEDGSVQPPFIVLADIQMPRMNGVELIAKIRQHPEASDTVIFVLTTSRARRDITESYRHHVAGYFCKEDAGRNFEKVVGIVQQYRELAMLPAVPQ
ncbi:response regulator [Kordiimonas sp.]|uniref:response regulator n=1 Tax=Kordiimonas sp. TaxID=1970157 RepID=UPI003A8F6719